MEIDIKELTKIKIEPDEVLLITLGEKIIGRHNYIEADRIIRSSFEKLGITKIIIQSAEAVKEIKVIKQVEGKGIKALFPDEVINNQELDLKFKEINGIDPTVGSVVKVDGDSYYKTAESKWIK